MNKDNSTDWMVRDWLNAGANAEFARKDRIEKEEKETQRRADLYTELLDALKMMVTISSEAHIHWDNDNDAKVGKLLIAMSGHMPSYDARITAIHTAIAKAEGKS